MSEMKKYMDVVRLGHKTTVDVLKIGDQIIIQEKIDGANSSFQRDGNSRNILAFSRNTQLSEENTLRGFYGWTQQLNAEDLTNGYLYFGEWLVQHKVNYGENANQFYLFDVYNTLTGKYESFSVVKKEAQRLNLNLIPVFYEGEYQGFEHLQSFVGQSKLGGNLNGIETGEGIVVKNVNYQDRFGNQLFVKLVTDKFREVQKQKAPKDPQSPIEIQFINNFLTAARVEKLLHKLVDENIIDESFGIGDMGTILKNLGNRVYDDMLKEEKDSLPEDFKEKDIKKSIGKKLPLIVKEIINNK